MAIGDALSKYWTYAKIEDAARLRVGSIADTMLSPTLALDIISMGIQKIAKRLNGSAAPWYMTTKSTLTISGSSNPYTVDLSSVAPFIDQVIRVIHVTAGGARTIARKMQPEEAENFSTMTSAYGSSLSYLHEGDGIILNKLSTFTVTPSTDTVELKYYRQPKIGTTSSAAVISDVAFTATSTVITNFTGMTTALVGATFVGLDSAAARTVTKYISATSFEISSALAAEGAGTNGYLIPPNSNTYTTTRGTYIDLPDSYASLLLDDVVSNFIRLKNNGQGDASLEASVNRQMQDVYTIVAQEKMQTQAEK
jgi:hypothetical protein